MVRQRRYLPLCLLNKYTLYNRALYTYVNECSYMHQHWKPLQSLCSRSGYGPIHMRSCCTQRHSPFNFRPRVCYLDVTQMRSLQISGVSKNLHRTEDTHLGALMNGQEISSCEVTSSGMRAGRHRLWLSPAQALPRPSQD